MRSIKRQNPFRYGIAVDDPYFIDREEELKDFHQWLTSASSVQRAVERLIKDDILERKGNKYVFTDPFFKYWLNNL